MESGSDRLVAGALDQVLVEDRDGEPEFIAGLQRTRDFDFVFHLFEPCVDALRDCHGDAVEDFYLFHVFPL